MTGDEYIEVVGGPLDGSRMELTKDTELGFHYRANDKSYFYRLIPSPDGRAAAKRRRFVFKEVNIDKRKSKGEEG